MFLDIFLPGRVAAEAAGVWPFLAFFRGLGGFMPKKFALRGRLTKTLSEFLLLENFRGKAFAKLLVLF